MNPFDVVATTSEVPRLFIVDSFEKIGTPVFTLTAQPLWVDLELQSNMVYNIFICLEIGENEPANAIMIIYDFAEDDDRPRNEWGLLLPKIGRFRYPPRRPDGSVVCKIVSPASGHLRIGLRTFRNQGPIRTSREIAACQLDESMLIAMTDAELSAFRARLESAQIYLEFGAGGSTVLAAKMKRHIHVIESDPTWITKLRGYEEIRTAETEGRLAFHHVDIGPIGSFGDPIDSSRASEWPKYYLGIWGDLNEDEPDLILVDGRFRLACAVAGLIAAPNALVMIHDVGKPGARRRHYDRILEVAEEVQRVESLLMVRRGPSWSNRQALALMAQGAADPS